MRLIDADKLKEQLQQRYEKAKIWRSQTPYIEKADGVISAFIEAIMTVNDAPTVGKWIETHEVFDYIACSECGKKWCIEDNDTEAFRYCPNCGARNEKY